MEGLWVALLVGLLAVTSAAAPITVDRTAGSLRLEAAIPVRTFVMGAPVPVSLSVRNTGSAAATISFGSSQRYDIIARRPRGDEVWRWSHDKAFIQTVQVLALKPGEELTYRISWDQRDLQGRQVDPGTYEIIAVFMGRQESDSGPAITLPPLTITIGP